MTKTKSNKKKTKIWKTIYWCCPMIIGLGLLLIIPFLDIKPESQRKWFNPHITCSTGADLIIDETRDNELNSEHYSISDYQTFKPLAISKYCQEMKANFHDSNLTNAEAETIYEALGSPIQFELTENEVELQNYVAIKKIDDQNYEMFYITSGCTEQLIYQKFELEDNKIINIQDLERWQMKDDCDEAIDPYPSAI